MTLAVPDMLIARHAEFVAHGIKLSRVDSIRETRTTTKQLTTQSQNHTSGQQLIHIYGVEGLGTPPAMGYLWSI
jgi:hypothetical protein